MPAEDELETARRDVEESLPELEEIADDGLRRKVRDVWAKGLADSGYTSIGEMTWGAGYDDVDGERQLDHVREVTRCAIAIADTLGDTRGLDIDRDVLVAGALLHDVSKFHEKAPDVEGWTEVGELLDHPHYAIHMMEEAGIPMAIQHVVLVHTHRSGPSPQTIEAQLVVLADLASIESIVWDNAGELLFEINAENLRS